MVLIMIADIDYDDNYEGGALYCAKINQLTFQTKSEPLDESEPTDDSEVEEVDESGVSGKQVNNLLPLFVGI